MKAIKEHLSDGVYAEVDAYNDLVLTTEDGVSSTNMIILEEKIVQRLLDFIKEHQSK